MPIFKSLLVVPGYVAQSVGSPAADPGVVSLIPAWSHTFVEIDHEIISLVILLPLIQEGLLSVTGEIMCMNYWFTAKSKFAMEKSVVR